MCTSWEEGTQTSGLFPHSWFLCSVTSASESKTEGQVVFPLNLGTCLTIQSDVVQGRKGKPGRERGYGQPCGEDNRRWLVQTHHYAPYRDVAQHTETRNNKCTRATTCRNTWPCWPQLLALCPTQLTSLLQSCLQRVHVAFANLYFPSCHQTLFCLARDRGRGWSNSLP